MTGSPQSDRLQCLRMVCPRRKLYDVAVIISTIIIIIAHMVFYIHLTDLEAMGMPVSSTGPIPENLISLSSPDLRGKVVEPMAWTPLEKPSGLKAKKSINTWLN